MGDRDREVLSDDAPLVEHPVARRLPGRRKAGAASVSVDQQQVQSRVSGKGDADAESRAGDDSAFPDYLTPLELFARARETKQPVRICAPMVRYSKLGFRELVRAFGCDLAYTPMTVAENFILSKRGRDNDFSTNEYDHPVIVQFAAKHTEMLCTAAEMVAPYVDGIDINCGCPQRWAMSEGYGSALLRKPQLIYDMVRAAKSRITIPVSVKIRINLDFKKTIELAQTAERAGADWIAVHGRTPSMRHEPVILEGIKAVKDNVSIPVVANGDINSMLDVNAVAAATGVDGVMSARGLLANPALFGGYAFAPASCLDKWIQIALSSRIPYSLFHTHVMNMDDPRVLSKEARARFFATQSYDDGIAELKREHPSIQAHLAPLQPERHCEKVIDAGDEPNKKARRAAILGLPLEPELPANPSADADDSSDVALIPW
ncbi:hypothetical protein CAOG_03762 [Capsaspora owczarzaki ATCC 30864]|uniref:tRNA-dihydrouridine(20a/20b) synthase [NAD(P)+] n=1 Tax=Capsaspora owczarzaki (strain ATCC 30864) TaxID=595528 RepID=A0A0D2VQE2_CAPO3|nr:hypothetical protein CAOG_03762 [Capsaspora owczarzaki ATCC 30864]KJE92872.1 hypothetical protein CAOG_003762 [Capsaspora owczarzaki ATCC 30864]|eukprot:XP_004363490.1 hypothetical protein CAOG_03762 [Capsaspora owczarzaki ATCC 30864]